MTEQVCIHFLFEELYVTQLIFFLLPHWTTLISGPCMCLCTCADVKKVCVCDNVTCVGTCYQMIERILRERKSMFKRNNKETSITAFGNVILL